MFKVILLGGDTDTNACIVGYMMGALRGLDGIPEVRSMQVEISCYIWVMGLRKGGNCIICIICFIS
jgi:ADP-ribosylglycohydrolase